MANGKKLFVNNTGMDLTLTLLVRQGDNPADEAGSVIVKLAKGEKKSQTYGSDTNSIYLNGVALEVVGRGSAFDDLLNTHNTITFSDASASQIKISASNT